MHSIVSPSASRTCIETSCFCHSDKVSLNPPPISKIPWVTSSNTPIAGTGLFSMALICPAIERSSGLTPDNVSPLNQILLSGPGPPHRCNVMSVSLRIPWETKRAAFTARINTSILPESPAKSFRFNLPELGAICPMMAKCLRKISPHF